MSVIEQKIVLKAVDEASRSIKTVSDSAKKGAEEVVRANEKTKLSYENLKHGIGLTAGAFTAVSASAVLAGKSLVDTEIQVNRIEKALKIYTGSMDGASTEITFLKDQSKRLGLEFSSTALAYSQLAVASKNTAITSTQVKDIFIGVSEASSALGLSSYQTESALRAINQMMSKGTVQAEELRGQLAESGIAGAFGMAAKVMGVTEIQLGKMMEKGEVMASDLLPKLAQELHKTFGPEAEAGSKGMAGQVNALKNAFFDLKEDLLNGGSSSLLTGIFEAGTRAVKGYTDEIKRALGGEISNLGKFTSDFNDKQIELTESLIKSKKEWQENAKILSPFSGELERSRKELVENKNSLDNLMGVGYSDKFLKKNIQDQQIFVDKLKLSNTELVKQEQSILKAENDKKSKLGGGKVESESEKKQRMKAIQSQIDDAREVDEYITQHNEKYNDIFLKQEQDKANDLREIDQYILDNNKEFEKSRVEAKYSAERLMLESQEDSYEKEKALVDLKYRELSDVAFNEKAKEAQYLIDLENKKNIELVKIDEKLMKQKKQLAFDTANTVIGTMKLMAGTGKKYALLNKTLAIADIGVNTARSVMQAVSSPPGPPWTIPLATAIGAMGAVQIGKASQAKFASTGADFITNGPQLMVVGENSGGREHVQVTPMSSPNINGPKSVSNNTSFGNINITVQNGGDLISMLESNPDRFNKLLKNSLKRGALNGVL